MSQVIEPTVGRVVWYYPPRGDRWFRFAPLAALVCCVHGSRDVNLHVVDPEGNYVANPPQHVRLVQPGDEIPEHGGYCGWMPYQAKQAGLEVPDGYPGKSPASDAGPVSMEPEVELVEQSDDKDAFDATSVASIGLDDRIVECLQAAGLLTVGAVVRYANEHDLKELDGIGKASEEDIMEAIQRLAEPDVPADS